VGPVMMAELDIGQHCSLATCKQLDFLPCECDLCGLVFCKDHAAYDAHSCSKYDSAAAAAHDSKQSACTSLSYPCSVSGCSSRELVEIRCSLCGNCYCLAHRHGDDHKCTSAPDVQKEKLPKTTQLVNKMLNAKSTISKPAKLSAKSSAKSAATASKIALIKLKQHATGDKSIPDADRVFFNVILPRGSHKRSMPMYFSQSWFVGKAIDKVASAASVSNKNNIAGAQRLCMFEASSGHVCPSGLKISSLLDASSDVSLYSGATVILEYADESTEHLPLLESYLNVL